MQNPVPGNVVRAINYYNSPGWGAPITADAGYRGELGNINLGGDIGLYHMAIDKNPEVQAEIERAISTCGNRRRRQKHRRDRGHKIVIRPRGTKADRSKIARKEARLLRGTFISPFSCLPTPQESQSAQLSQ
jgi:hypothetical protein